jgi:hypothetical protein
MEKIMSKPKLPTNPFKPQAAQYFEELNNLLEFTADEIAMLERNGFVVLDRLRFKQFKRAYAWIYWKDLPVLVTTDAILHSIHQTYDELLKEVEINILTEKLASLLENTRNYLRGAAIANSEAEYAAYYDNRMDERLNTLYADLDLYLTLPILLLKENKNRVFFDSIDFSPEDPKETLKQWLEQITWSNRNKDFNYVRMNADGKAEVEHTNVGTQKIALFGLSRELDFSQFQARGHYDEPPALVAYFAAMMWLQLLDFRFVEYDSSGKAEVHKQQIAAAYVLYDALEKSEQRQAWDEIESLLSAFVGWSDNITINGLERLFQKLGIQSASDCLDTDSQKFLEILSQEDFGQQKIRGQFQSRQKHLEAELPHNISFALIGQRYTVESDILQQLVFDKLTVNGEVVPRAYPSPLDLLYVLGNERALNHLTDELAQYHYQENLGSLRSWLNTHSTEFWQSSFYNYWLNAIRALNLDTTSKNYPTALRTHAWADKTLNTQLASWTQLRHDNILYVKPPFSPSIVCEYPAGYVEPYPDFYAALSDYARYGQEIFAKLGFPEFEEPYEKIQERLGRDLWLHDHEYRSQKAPYIRDKALRYFQELERIMLQLKSLAEKELEGQAFNEQDNLFLRSIIVRKYIGDTGYGGWTEEDWDGWYNDLLPFGDDSNQLIADVYTNYNSEIGEVGVLHLGTDYPNPIVMLVDCQDKPKLYIGVSYTVYQHLERSNPPTRLTDNEWQRALYQRTQMQRESSLKAYEAQRAEYEKLYAMADNDEARKRLEAYLGKRIRNMEHDLAQDLLSLPIWVKSFRVVADSQEMIDLPSAYSDFAEALSPDLSALLESIYEELGDSQGFTLSGRRSLASLVRTILNEPERIRAIKGMTEALFDELQQKLEEKGHLKQ